MMALALPAWAAIPAALLLIVAGLFTLIGAIGLLRFRDFYVRIHSPTLGTTLGAGCVLLASMLVTSALSGHLSLRELLITVFMVISAPVTTLLLMRAAATRPKLRKNEHETTPSP
jgi:multicomponent K+:H+ antiporter subunit G